MSELEKALKNNFSSVEDAMEDVRQGKMIAKGTTRNSSNDANDFFEVHLKPGSYHVRYHLGDQVIQQAIEVKSKPQQVFRLKMVPQK